MPQTQDDKDRNRLHRIAARQRKARADADEFQRERDALVLELAGRGWTYQRIADAAGMSTGNVFHIMEHARRASEKAKAKA